MQIGLFILGVNSDWLVNLLPIMLVSRVLYQLSISKTILPRLGYAYLSSGQYKPSGGMCESIHCYDPSRVQRVSLLDISDFLHIVYFNCNYCGYH